MDEQGGYNDAMKYLSRIGALKWLDQNEPWKLKGKRADTLINLANKFDQEGINTRRQFEAKYGPTDDIERPEVYIGKSDSKVAKENKK